MVDFKQRFHNTDKFRQAALHFLQYGTYTDAPRGTSDYVKYWDQETERCLNGYTAEDGEYITGYHYFYLNYSPIYTVKVSDYIDRYGIKRQRRERSFGFPSFWDYDAFYFYAIEDAELAGQHMAVMKARKKGYSFKGASMLVRNYEFIPGSKNFAIASEQKFLIGDGLLTKAWQIMDFVDKNTAWAKQRLKSTAMERTSGFKVKDEFGKETEQGYQSSIIGITLKNDPERIRGTRGKLFLWEEAGKFENLQEAWSIARASLELDDGTTFGAMQIMYGTGGTEGAAFDGLKDAFYHPSSYNIYEFPNIWDEDVDENSKCAFFVPQWANMEGFDEDGNQKYMDKDGNSLRDIAIRECVKQRKIVQEGKGDQQLLDRYVAERPLTPAEAMLELGGNIFPRKLLLNQLSRLRTNTKLQSMKHVVDLRWDGNGGVEAVEKKSGDITTYPLKNGEKPEGSIVIWEYPITDPPYGLYIAGCLPPGEKVLTQRGLINVEDVTLDDELIGRRGQQVRIKNLQRYNKKDENIYEIRPYGSFRSTKFTGEHPIWTKNRGWVLAKNLNIDDTLEIPNKYKHTNNTIKDWWTPKLFYFFGLWLGDGFVNINKNAYNIYISIGNDEVELSQYYQYLIKELFDRSACLAHKNKEQTRVFTHKKLATFLTDNFGKTAYHKRVPEWVKTAPNNLRRAFIQGYLDSDGSVFYDNGKVRANFTSVNLELLEDIQDILYGLEIRNSIVIHQKECKNRFGSISLQSYRINIARCDTIKLTYDRVFDSRKQKILKFSGISSYKKSKIQFDEDNILLKINNINISKYSGIVYNFECETHEYMVRNILTHNCDPYDMNESGTNSLGSVIIFKRFKAGEAWVDTIVAEYSGRPSTADEFYENVRKLLLFYNARCLYENEKIGIYQHFINKHCDYLLADQPDKVIAQIFRDSKVNRKKGCHMTKQVRQYAEEKINEWLREEYEPGHPNLERIYSEPLLEELIMNNGERNVDRVIALCMVMIFREELYQVKVQANKDENKQVQLFDMPLFGSQWWSETPQEDDVPIFTF